VPEKEESLSDFLKKFATALSFKVEEEPYEGDNLYAYVYVEHGGLKIYGDSNMESGQVLSFLISHA
jgi:hypothetical protein